ncbi:MAG: cob(I)yrinic acid a,c-diamide adenosyltransferase [Bacteroidales bacterium]|nr:cob(I)yrinic acid a,c-diamide adenosyltransferase [Bacteroidales bacterium]
MKSNVYTRTGDAGTTSLVGGERIAKDDARLEAYGTVDELNSWIGLLASLPSVGPDAQAILRGVSNRLFDIGCALATAPGSSWQPPEFPAAEVLALEAAIDALDAALPRHNRFILPSGHPDSARANIARSVARRAERRIITLVALAPVDPAILRYINRLSDYLFILGRYINVSNGAEEVFWEPLPQGDK